MSKTENRLWVVANQAIFIFNLCVHSKLCLDLTEEVRLFQESISSIKVGITSSFK